MKIVAVNGSHKGETGNTNIMVNAFLKGAEKAGAEIVNIILAKKDLKPCRACKACWFNTPGQCIIKDDMTSILQLLKDADVWIWATPLYFDNISSILKIFIERLMVIGSPYWEKDNAGECRHLTTRTIPKLIMISNCGFPERSHFQVISHWINRHARNFGTELIGEIYTSEGALLSTQVAELHPIISNYLQVLETAGKEVVISTQLSEKTKKLLEQKFIPDEIYTQEAKRYVDSILINKP